MIGTQLGATVVAPVDPKFRPPTILGWRKKKERKNSPCRRHHSGYHGVAAVPLAYVSTVLSYNEAPLGVCIVVDQLRLIAVAPTIADTYSGLASCSLFVFYFFLSFFFFLPPTSYSASGTELHAHPFLPSSPEPPNPIPPNVLLVVALVPSISY